MHPHKTPCQRSFDPIDECAEGELGFEMNEGTEAADPILSAAYEWQVKDGTRTTSLIATFLFALRDHNQMLLFSPLAN